MGVQYMCDEYGCHVELMGVCIRKVRRSCTLNIGDA
jgi:hypothetical protein